MKKGNTVKALSEVLNFNNECERLMASDDVKNPILRFELYQSLVETDSIKESFSNVRKTLFEKYGDPIPEDKIEDFKKEIEPLLKEEISLKFLISKKLIMELESSIPIVIFGFMK